MKQSYRDLIRHRWHLATIINAAASESGYTVQQLIGASRNRELVVPRWVVSRIARDDGYSYAQIGRAMRRDHTSILHGIRSADSHESHVTEFGRDLVDLDRRVRQRLARGLGYDTPPDPPIKIAPPAPPLPKRVAVPPSLDAMRRQERDAERRSDLNVLKASAMTRKPRMVTKSGYVNAYGEIVLWED